MSRIAKYPVPLPKGVELTLAGGQISVKGPLGTVARAADPNVDVKKEGEQIVFKALGNSNHANAMSGTMRALVAGMVVGVTKGFEKKLALVGVGYRAQAQGDKLNLTLGFSHPVVHQMPKGIKVATPTQTENGTAAAGTGSSVQEAALTLTSGGRTSTPRRWASRTRLAGG